MMRSLLRRSCAPVCCGIFLLLAGCQPVREDRSINFAPDGQAVAFQHGGEGVFLADKDTGKLTKIFQPGPDVVATGSPLWSPTGKRVLFTTARGTTNGRPATAALLPGSETDPAGGIFFRHDDEVVYTCYLYEETADKEPAKPTALFEAACDHAGYVAANLAVRWHPKGDRVLYIKRGTDKQHGLYEYDLATKASRRVFPHGGDALLFDASPDGKHLACVLADLQQPQNNGIWIGPPDGDDCWHVPQSDALAPGEFASALEQLRATRPAWTSDGTRFAFANWTPGKADKDPGRHFLRLATLEGKKVETLAEGPEPFRDLHWAPDGERLGVVRGTEKATLHVAGKGGELSEPVNRRPVRQFAGWNATGKRLAYLVPDDKEAAKAAEWALLLLPDPRARDAVYVADGGGTEAGREVFSGMRVTFPQWSPAEDKLSLWFTFAPTYRSALSLILGGGLRRGDPAALFDPAAEKITWLAVNPHEKAQVGHYYLLKRDYAAAWKWYEEAERDWPQPKPADAGPNPNAVRELTQPRDIKFFQYYCLTKLGRKDDAQAKLAEFRKAFPARPDKPQGQNPTTEEAWLRDVLDPDGLVAPLVRDFYCAEVFLSLDAAADAETYFREEMKTAPTDAARLSSAVVLAQLRLLADEPREYADVTADTVAPLMLKVVKARPAGTAANPLDLQTATETIGQFALLPLIAPKFLAALPDEKVRSLAERLEALRPKAENDYGRLEIDLVLRAAYQRLGMSKEHDEAALRLRDNPAPTLVPRTEGDVDQFIDTTRVLLTGLLQRR